MTSLPLRVWATIFSAIALTAAWHWAPTDTPAVYDGICSTDPYRYVVGGSAGVPKPTPASEIVPLSNGQVPTIELTADNDNNPQAQLLVLANSVKLPTGATAVKLSITAHAPPSTKPPMGHVDGNVYTFEITSRDGDAVSIPQSPTIVLRSATQDQSPRTIEHFDGKAWAELKTTSVGCADTVETAITQLGDYAVVAPGVKLPPPTQADKPTPWGMVSLVAALAVFAGAAIVAAKRRRAA